MTQPDDLGDMDDDGAFAPQMLFIPDDYRPSERAYFAAHILPALISDKALRKVFCDDAEDLGTSHYEQAAYHALRHADALIAALKEAPVRSARPPSWDAPPPRPAPPQPAPAVGREPVVLSDKMVATLTIMAKGLPQPVAAAQAKFFERHGLAVACPRMRAPRPPYRMMEITPDGIATLAAARKARTDA